MRIFAALAAVCAISLAFNGFLALRLSASSDKIARLTGDINNLISARRADETAQALRDRIYREVHDNARRKHDALVEIPLDPAVPVADLLRDWLGVLSQGADSRRGAAGKPDGGLPDTRSSGRAAEGN